jgi:L-ribulokinase
MAKNYVIGMDYGSDSVRALLVDAETGKELGESVFEYPRWKQGKYCLPGENQFRQHPLDYLEGLETTIKAVLKQAGPDAAAAVRGIAVDTTGSTPVAVDKEGTPLALRPEFAENPNAMFVLWKDHTAIKEAAEVNELARSWGGEDFTKFEGGVYSSEWFWAKILHILRADESVRKEAHSWVEHCDWIPAVLTGQSNPETMYRSRCAAGHKAMWHEDFKGLPADDFLTRLDPLLSGLRDRLFRHTDTAEKKVGTLTPEWAAKLGLSEEVVIGGSAFDAHMGAVGGEIKPYDMCKVIGTSTCDIMVTPTDVMGDKLVGGICGQVDGSVLPGSMGLEAGQSAFGDIYAWFKRILMWPIEELVDDEELKIKLSKKLLPYIEGVAATLPLDSDLVALDWMNGRRTPWADQSLKGVVAGINLGTDAPRFYRSLVEATAFGSRKIMERFLEEGVEIRRIVAIGGVAKKSPFVMQILTDVMNREIVVAESDQAVALGSAMFAAVAAGIHKDLEAAQEAMGSGFSAEYKPIPERVAHYEKLYAKYDKLGGLLDKQYYHSDKEEE